MGISVSEFGEILKGIGWNLVESQIGAIMKKLDLDGDGKVNVEEFTKYMETARSRLRGMMMRAAFTEMDKDGGSSLTADELKAVIEKSGGGWTAEEIDAMVAKADTDGDGKINFEEF